MKIIKTMWGKARDKTVTALSDIMVEYPNFAMVCIIVDVVFTVVILLTMGSDAPLTLNE